MQGIPPLHYRGLAAGFFDLWKNQASDLSAKAVALALRTASQAERLYREQQAIEMVWTGSDSGVMR